jgi:hypothetical protein
MPEAAIGRLAELALAEEQTEPTERLGVERPTVLPIKPERPRFVAVLNPYDQLRV